MTTPSPLIAAALLACSAPSLFAQDDAARAPDVAPGLTAMAIDAELRTSLVRVLSIDGTRVVGEDRRGRERVYRDGDLVALLRVEPGVDVSAGVGAASLGGAEDMDFARLLERSGASASGVLVTTSGSRIPGTLRALVDSGSPGSAEDAAPEDPDAVVWVTELGTRVFAIESVSRIVLGHAPASVRLTLPEGVATDTMLLSNGDALEGFVASFGREAVLERDDGAEVRLAPERVNAVVFANPDEAPTGIRVWYDDGGVSAGDALRTTDAQWIGLEQGPPGTSDPAFRDIGGVRAIAFDAGRLVALSGLEASVLGREGFDGTLVETHPDDLLLEEAPALGAANVVLPGPMRVTYDLPANVERFAATVRLTHAPSSWSHCTLIVRADGAVLAEMELDADRPVRALSLALEGASTLELELDEGRFGPVLDRVELGRPLLLLSE